MSQRTQVCVLVGLACLAGFVHFRYASVSAGGVDCGSPGSPHELFLESGLYAELDERACADAIDQRSTWSTIAFVGVLLVSAVTYGSARSEQHEGSEGSAPAGPPVGG